MALDRIRTRFAPSPTGYMHVGNLRTALYTYLTAKKFNGDFILRIEDTDQARQVEGAVDIIYNTLKENGLFWEAMTDTAATFQRKKFRQDLTPAKNMLSDRKFRRQGKHILTI